MEHTARAVLCVFVLMISAAAEAHVLQWQRYLKDTVASLECMRQETGLWSDKVLVTGDPKSTCPVAPLLGPTSPTNIALDLLLQMEFVQRGQNVRLAHRRVLQVVKTLEKMDYHKESGLFLNRYSPHKDLEVKEELVSTVDNIHLAFALWAVSRQFVGLQAGEKARLLFERMNFSVFYDPADGLFYGAMRKRDDHWYLEEWKYRYFGSEARSLYSLGYALGLIKDPGFLDKAFQNLHAEIYTEKGKRLLALWDGGAFQLMLPRLLVNEGRYAPIFNELYLNFADAVLTEQDSYHLAMPAAFSACQYGIDDPNGCGDYPCYNGKVGLPSLVSSFHVDIKDPVLRKNWDRVVSPHGVFLSALPQPVTFANRLKAAERLSQGSLPLYVAGLGWLDGYHVRDREKGVVVPVLLSLNQAMAALALYQMLSPDQMTAGARLLDMDLVIRPKLNSFYDRVQKMLLRAPDRPDITKLLPALSR